MGGFGWTAERGPEDDGSERCGDRSDGASVPRGPSADAPQFLAEVVEPNRCVGGERLKVVARARTERGDDRQRAHGQEERRKSPIRRSRASFTVFFFLAALALPLAASCSPSTPAVEGRWTGSLALGNGGLYDPVRLDLVQDSERLSGSGVMVAGVPGEDDAPVEVAEGSRVVGEEITLVLRDTVYGTLDVRLEGVVEDARIEAEGSYRTPTIDAAAALDLAR